MKKRMRGLLAVVLLLALTVTQVFAATFPDVPSEKYSWAVKEIDSMASDGIVKGFEDGTFRPENVVTKLDALLLVARILGANDSENELLCEVAAEVFGDVVDGFELPYGKNEIAFLLMKGVMTEDELKDYVTSDNRSNGLKRYEVAMLLTKAMGAEASVKESVISVLEYSDTTEIPANAKKYVEYVTTQGLMQGMDAELNTFVPMGNVTRAQAAVVLSKLRDKMAYENLQGIVTSVDATGKTIKIKGIDGESYGYTVLNSVALRFEGDLIALSDVKAGMEVVITLSNDALFALDFVTAQVDEEVSGKIKSVVRDVQYGTTIKIDKGNLAKADVVEYKVSDSVVVTYNGKAATLNDVKSNDYAVLTVKGGKVTVIAAEAGSKKVSGSVLEIGFDPTLNITISVNGSDEENYEVNSDVAVIKNGEHADMREILVGDRVTLTIKSNTVAEIDATSTTTTKNGVVDSLYISSNGCEIGLKVDGKVTEYPLASNAQISLDGRDGNMYDLRVGVGAKVKVESNTIVSINTSAVETVTQMQGKIEVMNASYGMIQITYYDSALSQQRTEQIFIKDNAKIVDNTTGRDIKVKNLEVGKTVSVIGALNNGVFEASTVIVIG
ncbi:MAG: S-layer homology domain-containing protein [Ruminococcaceae bacterium]|nr:S-layer homology domain-containing protein [Oscillospiraceae bacterium]